MCLQVILLLSVFTNQLSIYLSYLEDKEVLNGVVNNVAKVSETAMIESTSEENLVSTYSLLLLLIFFIYRPNKYNFERSCMSRHLSLLHLSICYKF
jgi:hypothetical protein